MLFQDEPDSDAKDRFRTRIGEWKTSDKKGVYGEAKEVGGIHGDDIAKSAVSYHTLVDMVAHNYPNDLTAFKLVNLSDNSILDWKDGRRSVQKVCRVTRGQQSR